MHRNMRHCVRIRWHHQSTYCMHNQNKLLLNSTLSNFEVKSITIDDTNYYLETTYKGKTHDNASRFGTRGNQEIMQLSSINSLRKCTHARTQRILNDKRTRSFN